MKSVAQNLVKHFTTLNDLSNEEIYHLIEKALQYKHGEINNNFHEHYAINCFFEDSTRTHKSFEMAERKLGMQVMDFQPSTSSIRKGESLYDTIMTLQSIGVDLIVIRHSQEDFYKKLISSPNLTSSIINGGDGAGQHPSQSLLDLMTIYEEFGTFKDLKIAVAGDLSHSRVAKSNVQILNRLGAEVFYTGPKEWLDPSFGIYGEYAKIDELARKVDVMMLLRVQHERHIEKDKIFSKEEYLEKYGLTIERENTMKKSAIIMHPAPVNRGVEIASQLVESKRSRIFTQMKNGVYARMAIIDSVIN